MAGLGVEVSRQGRSAATVYLRYPPKGSAAEFRFVAPREVRIHLAEAYQLIQEERRAEAATGGPVYGPETSLRALRRDLQKTEQSGPNYVARLRATVALGLHPDPKAGTLLLSHLGPEEEGMPSVRIAALTACIERDAAGLLSAEDKKGVLGAITGALLNGEEPDEFVRKAGVVRLPLLAGEEDRGAVRGVLSEAARKDTSDLVREAARAALERMDGEEEGDALDDFYAGGAGWPGGPASGLEEGSVPRAEMGVLRGHENRVFGVAVSPDGRTIASVGADGAARLWDAVSGNTTAVLRPPEGRGGLALTQVIFSPDGSRLATVNGDRTIQLWDPGEGALVDSFRPDLKGRARAQVCIQPSFLPDGRLVALVSDEVDLRLWDVQGKSTLRILHSFVPQDAIKGYDYVESAAFSRDGKRVVTGSAQGFQLWDLEADEPLLRSWQVGETVRAVVFSPDGNLVATGGDNRRVQLWGSQSDRPVRVFAAHENSIAAVVFSPDGKWLASSGYDNSVWVHPLEGDSDAIRLAGHEDAVTGLAAAPDGMGLISSSWDRSLRIWGPEPERLTDRLDAALAGDPAEAAALLRLLGTEGGQGVVDRLAGLLPRCPEGLRMEMVMALLAASSRSKDPAPLNSVQWDLVLQALREIVDGGEMPPVGWLVRLEGVFLEALRLEGSPLEASVYEQSAWDLLDAIWAYPSREDRERRKERLSRLNEKDQLAHLLWNLSMRGRFPEYSHTAGELCFWPMQRGMTYPILGRVYETLHRYPVLARAALYNAGSRIQEISDKKRGYWEAFERWLVRMALMAGPFERMGLQRLFREQMNPKSWHDTAEALDQSSRALDREIAGSAEVLLLPEEPFDLERFPLVDTTRFPSERDRNRFLISLLYLADFPDEPLRAALAAYFKALEGKSHDLVAAALAAEEALLREARQRGAAIPPDAFLEGPGSYEFVVQPERPGPGVKEDILRHWSEAVAALSAMEGMSGISSGAREDLQRTREELARTVPPNRRRTMEAAQSRVRAAVQRAWDEAGTDLSFREALRPQIQAANQAMKQAVARVSQQEKQARPRLVRLGVQKDPVRRLTFSYPSRLCLDPVTGPHRWATGRYVTHLHHQIITAEDPDNPNVDPPLARLTVARAEDGSIVATNALSWPPGYDCLPAFVEYLELYATATQAPAVLPVDFFPGLPGRGWRRGRVDLVLPAGMDPRFHMDLTEAEKFPHTIRGLEAWVYTPPSDPASVVLRGARSTGRLNVLMRMMDQLLRARDPADAEGALLEAVRGILGYSGVSLYEVDAGGGPGREKIRSAVRSLEGESRASDWTEPQGEQREALERFRRGEGSLHIRDRSDRNSAPFVDPARLELDRRRYPGGNVGEVYYVTLANAAGEPWGLLMVNRWASGEPLFPGVAPGSDLEREYEETVRGVLQTLGNGALLALEGARNIQELIGYMDLQSRSSEISARLGALTKSLRSLSTLAGLTVLQISEFEELGGEVADLARELEDSARATMEVVRERRERPAAPRGGEAAPAPVTNLSTLEYLFGDLSLTLLGTVAEGEAGQLKRARDNFLDTTDFPEGSVEREVAEEWIALAASAIEARNRIDEENRALPGRLAHLRERLQALEVLRERVESLVAENGMSREDSEAARRVAGEILQVSVDIRQFLDHLVGRGGADPAGLEEITAEEFARRAPEAGGQVPAGAERFFVAPLPDSVNVYGQGPAMSAGLEERFRRAGIPGLNVEVYEAPLPSGKSYERPGVIVEDEAIGAGVENPGRLMVIRLWLSDLENVNPAALVLAALGAIQHPDVKVLGAMVFRDAEGRASLVIFA